MLIVPAAVVGGASQDCDCRLVKLELLPGPTAGGGQYWMGPILNFSQT